MLKVILFLSFFFSFNAFVFAQDTKNQSDKSRINAPEVVKISRPAKATSAKETSPPKYYSSKEHRKQTAAKPTQRVGMKSVGSLEKELSVLKDKLTYLKQQPNTPAINAEITNLQTTITQKQQQINRFKATTK
jgi:hypothetical protein